jgi:hypothetical protein
MPMIITGHNGMYSKFNYVIMTYKYVLNGVRIGWRIGRLELWKNGLNERKCLDLSINPAFRGWSLLFLVEFYIINESLILPGLFVFLFLFYFHRKWLCSFACVKR